MIKNEIMPESYKPKFNFISIFLSVVLSLSFIGAIFASYYYGLSKNKSSISSTFPSPMLTSIIKNNLTPTVEPETVSGFGEISWLSSPKTIAIPDFFNKDKEGEYTTESAKFYQIATFSDGSTLNNILIENNNGMVGGLEIHHIIKKSSEEYYLINETDDYFVSIFNSNIVKSVNVNIPGLVSPDLLNLSKINLKKNNNYHSLNFTELKNPKLLEETKYGKIYVIYNSSSDEYTPLGQRTFYLLLKDETVVSYTDYFDFMTDDQVPKLTFSDNTTNKTAYQTGVRGGGCGAQIGNMIMSNNISTTSLKKIGTINTNRLSKDVYKIIDADSSILKIIYQEYKVGRDTNSASFIGDINKFIEAPTHFVWKDDLGDWNLFTNMDYSALAECAKPVIYLYPSKDTLTTVKVAADITQSEPQYSTDGWTVLAHPNGQLDYQGQSYPNLFWEGLGQGLYPNLNNRGVVVSQTDLIPTIKNQLFLQGLNQQETADFLEFWQSKLPITPYVRLSWLTTAEMNKLAPLKVSPSPNTTIRVFLDFEGLEKPLKLIPQEFSIPSRNGFTLVEWGGLLVKS